MGAYATRRRSRRSAARSSSVIQSDAGMPSTCSIASRRCDVGRVFARAQSETDGWLTPTRLARSVWDITRAGLSMAKAAARDALARVQGIGSCHSYGYADMQGPCVYRYGYGPVP